jgi:hypothetical protein
MNQADQPGPSGKAYESLHPTDPIPESADTSGVQAASAKAPADLVASLASRMDGMREWASETQSQVRGLVSGLQVLNNRTAALEELRDAVDLIGQQMGELTSLSSTSAQLSQETDGAIGYQPSVEQQALLFSALAEWQITAKQLEKSQTANIQTKSGGSVSYRYADIASVSEIARSAGAVGLAHFHREVAIQGQRFIRTYLVHKGGGWLSCEVPLLTKENTLISSLQQWASACTMARRYGLFMVLGIAAGDEDDDGISAGRRNPSASGAANQSPGPRSTGGRMPTPR